MAEHSTVPSSWSSKLSDWNYLVDYSKEVVPGGWWSNIVPGEKDSQAMLTRPK